MAKESLDSLFSKIIKDKKLDAEVVRDKNSLPEIPRYPLKSLTLQYLLGPGLPKGRFIEFYGMESSGKSLLAYIIARDIQKISDGVVIYIDAEHTFDFQFAEKMGLDVSPERFRVIHPDFGEQGLSIAEKLVESGIVNLIIYDSVDAFVPKAITMGEMEDHHMGVKARMWATAMHKLVPKMSKTGTSGILINQIRMKIGTMYGNPETTTGGLAIPFYCSVRNRIRKIQFIPKEDDPVAILIEIKNKKNKTSVPNRKAEITINFQNGLDYDAEKLMFATKYDVIKMGGAWITFDDDHKFQGFDKALEYFRTLSEEEKDVIAKKVLEKMFSTQTVLPDIVKKTKVRKNKVKVDEMIEEGKKDEEIEKLMEAEEDTYELDTEDSEDYTLD